MPENIPYEGKVLLKFIRETETGKDAGAYETIFGHNQDKLPKSITAMTIAEIQKAQPGWSKKFGSSATGAYQHMNATLKEQVKEGLADPTEKFTAAVQDRLGFALLKRRGFLSFMTGKIDRNEFAKRLAQEWASFPVLEPTQGAHRKLKRGQSYYAGDGLNKALVRPEDVERVLAEVQSVPRIVDSFADPVKPAQKPGSKSMTAATSLLAAGAMGVVYAASEWIGDTFRWIGSFF
ncbi:hypothetical protein [Aminobacter sp. BE322]|uniref:hypothetical protein n=1 Tax=unclassified Aminobacter TaxID=2644704 RepID=UPI003D1BBF7C